MGGHISTDTYWGDARQPYVLNGDLFIDPGVTLTLGPGVRLRTNNYQYDILVDGVLAATDASIELNGDGSYEESYLRVRNGGRLELSGGTLTGWPGYATVSSGGEANFSGATISWASLWYGHQDHGWTGCAAARTADSACRNEAVSDCHHVPGICEQSTGSPFSKQLRSMITVSASKPRK